jgi:hypothetical protein
MLFFSSIISVFCPWLADSEYHDAREAWSVGDPGVLLSAVEH